MIFGIILASIAFGFISSLIVYFSFIATVKFLKNNGFDKED